MSDVTGSLSIGDGFSIKYDLNPSTSNPTLKLTLMWESTVTIASTTLTKSETSATFGGKVPGTDLEAEATASFDFTTLVLSASVVVSTPAIPPLTKAKKTTYGPVSTKL